MYVDFARANRMKKVIWARNAGECEALRSFAGYPVMQVQSVERWFASTMFRFDIMREALGMPAKSRETFEWRGFVNVRLTERHKQALDAWDVHDGDVFDALGSYCEGGYKLSVSYRADDKSFVATFTGTSQAGKNAGKAVSAFAKDIYNALRVVLFKVSCILPDVWEDYEAASGDDIG